MVTHPASRGWVGPFGADEDLNNTNKKGRAKIRWKFAKRKPTGQYTLYVSFIPNKKYWQTRADGLEDHESSMRR